MQSVLSPKKIKQATRATQILGAYLRDGKLFVMFSGGVEFVFPCNAFGFKLSGLNMKDDLLYSGYKCLNSLIFKLLEKRCDGL